VWDLILPHWIEITLYINTTTGLKFYEGEVLNFSENREIKRLCLVKRQAWTRQLGLFFRRHFYAFWSLQWSLVAWVMLLSPLPSWSRETGATLTRQGYSRWCPWRCKLFCAYAHRSAGQLPGDEARIDDIYHGTCSF